MILHRKRFLFWLIRAYVKKWSKVFLLGFLIGIVLFIFIKENSSQIFTFLNVRQPLKVGIVGSFTLESLPFEIQNKISIGLTKIDETGIVQPAAAADWQVENDGKTYVFHLKKDLVFQDGKKFTSQDVNYNFKEAKVHFPDPYTVRFELEEPFAPLPVVLSRPIFKKGFVGLSDFKVKDVDRNGDFVKSLSLQNIHDSANQIVFRFYPIEQAVKTAFILGEVDEITISAPGEFTNWQTVLIEKNVDAKRLIVLFYNTRDSNLSKQVRQGLSYALPELQEGQRANSPLSLKSWTFKDQPEKFKRNVDNARRLLETDKKSSNLAALVFSLTTPARFKDVAEKIKQGLEEAGVSIHIEEVRERPSEFQLFLDQITLPLDPDQYNLWHSAGSTNITHYENPRIDKLLEDGRKTIDETKRKEIYDELQKYLVDDAPASFLYYPYVYTIKRR